MSTNDRLVRVSLVAKVAGVDCRTMKKRIAKLGIKTFQSGQRVLLVSEDDVIESELVDEADMMDATDTWEPRKSPGKCKMQ
jgi:3-deoxy-D-manno-octulosonate 8-phosphate phosphatase KdsC-like HAD superfamily phosphatase